MLCESLGIQLVLKPLDFEPFYHGFGKNCADPKLVFARWLLPLKYLNGIECELPFYIVKGDGPILIGNCIIAHCNLVGSENLLVIPKNVGDIKNNELLFATVHTYVDGEPSRTYLHVVPCHSEQLSSYFSSLSSFTSSLKDNRYRQGKEAHKFAIRFHMYTHLCPDDMSLVCKRAGILSPVLHQSLVKAFNKCTICKTTGRPRPSRKVSFSRLVSSFNHRLQVDYFYVKDLGKNSILHICDTHTSISVAVQVKSRDQELACQIIRTHWFDSYGTPAEIIGDPEFENGYIREILRVHGVTLLPCAARRHNKIGIVESNHRAIRLLTERLYKDAQRNHSLHGVKISDKEILSRAVFLKNIIHGNKKLSSFEQAKGYSPALRGIPQCLISEELAKSHYEKVARRSIFRFLQSSSSSVVSPLLLEPKTPVYYFVQTKNNQGGSWLLAFVQEKTDQYVSVTNSANGRGAHQKLRLKT